MGQDKITTRKRKSKYLSETERYKIEALRDRKLSGHEIARQLGRSPSTINRELARGKIELLGSELKKLVVYRANRGQMLYEERQKNKGRSVKIGYDHELSRYIERKIKEDRYSPEAVTGEIKNKGLRFKTKLCFKTIYNYIRSGIFAGVSDVDLVYGGRRKRRYRKVGKINKNRIFKSIEFRPQEVNERKDFGHWEMDVVKGKNRTRGCLLAFTDRFGRYDLIFKMKNCNSESVKKVLDELERELDKDFSNIFKTITIDNGSEFLVFEELEASVLRPGEKRTTVYYAHPYSSYERGSNENQNRMIRRFIPKGIDIGKVPVEKVKQVQNWMNGYPRGIFGYKSSIDIIKPFLTRKTCEILGVVQ